MVVRTIIVADDGILVDLDEDLERQLLMSLGFE
jgi:hypothetical protein